MMRADRRDRIAARADEQHRPVRQARREPAAAAVISAANPPRL
ncbi:hypothetical protein [Actinoplanes auranticolor]|nr:hypothetical protein [Actinoplanes auranticolor]